MERQIEMVLMSVNATIRMIRICEEYAKEDGQYGSWMKFLKGTLLKLRKDVSSTNQ